VLPGLLRTIGGMRRAGASRAADPGGGGEAAGIYVPAFYEVADEPRSELLVVIGRTPAGWPRGRRSGWSGCGSAISTSSRSRPSSRCRTRRRSSIARRWRSRAGARRAAASARRGSSTGRSASATPKAIVKAVLEGVDKGGLLRDEPDGAEHRGRVVHRPADQRAGAGAVQAEGQARGGEPARVRAQRRAARRDQERGDQRPDLRAGGRDAADARRDQQERQRRGHPGVGAADLRARLRPDQDVLHHGAADRDGGRCGRHRGDREPRARGGPGCGWRACRR
jgi:hypothetical protein